MIICPNSKRNKEHKVIVDGLSVGNEVVFAGGLIGKIKKIEGEYAIISPNNHTDVKIQRASVITVLPSGTMTISNYPFYHLRSPYALPCLEIFFDCKSAVTFAQHS